MNGTSIRTKLMRVLLLTNAAVLVLTCAAYFIYEVITFRNSAKSQLSTLGQIIAANSTAALAFDDENDAQEILNALKAEKNITEACIYDNNGRLFVKFPDSLSNKAFPAGSSATGYHFTSEFLEGFQPIVLGDNHLGVLYIKSDLKAMYERLKLYGLIACLFIAVSALFAYLLFRQLQKLITKPILDLAGTAKVISDQHDYSVRAHKSGDDELGALTDAFNQMLDQIETQNQEITFFNQTLGQRIQERTLELEKTNDVLTRQNEFVETIIDSSMDIIAVLDKELRYIAMNKQGENAYQMDKTHILGKRILDVFPQLMDSVIPVNIKRALKGEIVYDPNYVSPILNKYLENYYVPLKDEHDAVYRVLMIGHDITGIMEASRKLQDMNLELENSNQRLEQFAYIASHDLQEPLRKIQTFSELGEKNIDNPEIAKRYLGKILSAANRLSDLIRAILNFSRLSKKDIKWESTDLNQIVNNTKNDLELLIAEKKAVISSETLPVINAIPLQLNQLFLNIISNSLKFCEQTPYISIGSTILPGTDGRLKGLNSSGKYLELSFTDNGIGFEQKYADKIFDIFQRVHDHGNYPGTGIGLALCKKIADNHLGKITVTSKPGEGSTFRVYIPLAYQLHKDTIIE